MQNQMNAILNDPEMMGKIMQMAQSLSQSPPEQKEAQSKGPGEGFSMPEVDLAMVQKLSGLAGQTRIDKNQRNLLSALTPYLSRERISKLEKAMRAARMASMASGLLSSSGLQLMRGR